MDTLNDLIEAALFSISLDDYNKLRRDKVLYLDNPPAIAIGEKYVIGYKELMMTNRFLHYTISDFFPAVPKEDIEDYISAFELIVTIAKKNDANDPVALARAIVTAHGMNLPSTFVVPGLERPTYITIDQSMFEPILGYNKDQFADNMNVFDGKYYVTLLPLKER